jgi:uncharacterized membrane protein YgaE (UPF0421/DUF939 family)
LGRVRDAVWPAVLAAGAAGVAWFLAHSVLGHPQPIFAPIAAIVGLAGSAGERAERAIEMLVGVSAGVAVGQLLVPVLGTNPLQVALVVAVAMLAVAALVNGTIPLIQAGASAAIVVVVLQSAGSGGGRLSDVLIGGGVALLVSQVLFTPSPLSLLAGAGRKALGSIAEGLRASARALAGGDAAAAEAALECLREGESSVSHLAETRKTSRQIARRTLRGRRERGQQLEGLDARLGEVYLLFGSALLLARAAHRLLDEGITAPEWLHRAVDELARGVEALAEDPGSQDARRRARDLALEATRAVTSGASGADLRIVLVADQVRLAAADLARVAAPGEPKPEPAGEPSSGDARSSI